ncbi:hypothetical protein IMZ31_22430 (plasmid) [Pontibacillus sp. ALD_SL1]|uniref:hypothetical protein n=1 Tax=Pontibacillus sp. ALD_SL1 TaxID=2777185 RepID=UPI001A95A44E|nr:hypothetical protein [Pontibacillus sp. ALD_SL1]QST02213.1 hypothetical protein IMZ31_22430 [Pontibacillus sp. ALD_SL1]
MSAIVYVDETRVEKPFQHLDDAIFYLDQHTDSSHKEKYQSQQKVHILLLNEEGEHETFFKGTLLELLTPATLTLRVGPHDYGVFTEREQLDNTLRNLVNEQGASIKTNISIIDEGKGYFINQFLGEIWHYLDDWNDEMMPPKSS